MDDLLLIDVVLDVLLLRLHSTHERVMIEKEGVAAVT